MARATFKNLSEAQAGELVRLRFWGSDLYAIVWEFNEVKSFVVIAKDIQGERAPISLTLAEEQNNAVLLGRDWCFDFDPEDIKFGVPNDVLGDLRITDSGPALRCHDLDGVRYVTETGTLASPGHKAPVVSLWRIMNKDVNGKFEDVLAWPPPQD